MKIKLFAIILAGLFISCVNESPKASACVTHYTSGKKTNCAGSLSQISNKVWCQNVTNKELCVDVESCFVDDYALFNRFDGTNITCQDEAYLHGCGEGIFSINKENCP